MAGRPRSVPQALEALFVMVALAPAAGCDDGCEEGTRNVCDEEGESCFCATECTEDAGCAAGQYCFDETVCLGAPTDLAAALGCGAAGQPCCTVEPEDHEPVLACLRGFRCLGTGECQP